MSDLTALHAELAALRAENAHLRERTLAAERALAAVAPPGSDADAVRATPREGDGSEQRGAHEVAEIALQEMDRERRTLRAVLDALPVGVWIADANGRFTQCNPAAVRIWGGEAPTASTPAEYGVYRARWTKSGAPLEAAEWSLARTLATGATILGEAVDIERFDGTRGHILGSSAPILDDGGRMVGGVAVSVDVSDQYAAERERDELIQSLEFEQGRLGALLQKAPAFIAVLRGEHHVFEYVNEAYLAITGHRELLGKPVAEAIPEIVGQGYLELVSEVYRTGVPVVVSGQPVRLAQRPGGPPELLYIDLVYQEMVESDGTRSGVFVHGVDVTDKTLVQQRVRAQFHGVPVPTSVWKRVERHGKSLFELVDYNRAELEASRGASTLGESAGTYFAESPSIVAQLDRCLAEGTTLQGEVDRTTSLTGEKRRLFVTYSPAPPDLVLVHAEDITARVQLEQQLRQGQKMEAIGRLAGGVAHDFNNLLAVILSYADLASDGLAPGDQRHEDLQQIQKAARRATELTRQLLAFSRQQVLQPRIVELNGILVAMQQMLAPLLGADIELVTAFEDDTGRVMADPGQLEQVVMNLAVNARDAMPEGGTLSLEARNAELVPPGGDSLCRYVLLEVRDTGTGMDAATCARIFEPFFTSKAVGKGTGLGLATVFGIVEQSGGFIVVDSELGRGSSFKIYLPRTDRPEKISDSPVRAAKNAGSETILLVEDEEQVRTVAGLILRRNGYRVLEANDGFEALAVAAGHDAPIDLLLTDMSMPKMGGAKLAEALGKEHPRMKILFVSGYTDDALVRRGITSAGFAFLQKPFTLDTLLVKVREVLDENP